MHVCVLFRLQIESPIRSEKDFTSANMFIKWNDSLWIFDKKKIFFSNLEPLNSGRGLSASAAYTPVFTVIFFFFAKKGSSEISCLCTIVSGFKIPL